MIKVEQAVELIRRNVLPVEAEAVELDDAVGRVLAQDVFADTDLPPFNRAQMDGFAVRAEDVERAPVTLTIIGEARAGQRFDGEVQTGEAVRIMTGAPVPSGANAVQQVELTSPSHPNRITIETPCIIHQNVNLRASEIVKGAQVFARGEQITNQMIASLASFGCARLEVSRRPRVAVASTGAELVAVDAAPRSDGIRDSNSFMLAALAREAGAHVARLPVIADDLQVTENRIDEAAKNADVLILTGGVSVGDYDFTKPALRNLGAEIYFEKVALRPGKPTVFARLGETLVFALPGNPVSAAVTFYLFARLALMLMQKRQDASLVEAHAVLSSGVKAATGRASYLPATLETDAEGCLLARPVRWGGSSDFISFARAEALITLPADSGFIEAGSVVRVVCLPRG